MKPCISQATTMPGTFAEDVHAYAAGGCPAIEVWLTKLEQHLESHSLDETRRLLSERGVTLVAGSYQGGLLLSQGDARREHFEHFRRRLELCQALDIPTLVVVADFVQKIGLTDLQRAVVSLKQAAQWAAGFDVRLALEFRGGNTFCSTLETTLQLAEQCGEPNVGVCLDVFHYYTGPSKPEDLERLTRERLAHVQVCDVAGVPRELATDSDRVMPGEGDFRLTPIVDRLHEIEYDGWVSLELMNPVIWQVKATQVAELGMAALERITARQRA